MGNSIASNTIIRGEEDSSYGLTSDEILAKGCKMFRYLNDNKGKSDAVTDSVKDTLAKMFVSSYGKDLVLSQDIVDLFQLFDKKVNESERLKAEKLKEQPVVRKQSWADIMDDEEDPQELKEPLSNSVINVNILKNKTENEVKTNDKNENENSNPPSPQWRSAPTKKNNQSTRFQRDTDNSVNNVNRRPSRTNIPKYSTLKKNTRSTSLTPPELEKEKENDVLTQENVDKTDESKVHAMNKQWTCLYYLYSIFNKNSKRVCSNGDNCDFLHGLDDNNFPIGNVWSKTEVYDGIEFRLPSRENFVLFYPQNGTAPRIIEKRSQQ
jgi:hypothetical protein